MKKNQAPISITECNDVAERIMGIARTAPTGHVAHLGGAGRALDPRSLQVEETNRAAAEILGESKWDWGYSKMKKVDAQPAAPKTEAAKPRKKGKGKRGDKHWNKKKAYESVRDVRAGLVEQTNELLKVALGLAENRGTGKFDGLAGTIANRIAPKVERLLARLEAAEDEMGADPMTLDVDMDDSDMPELPELIQQTDEIVDALITQISDLADSADADTAAALDDISDQLQNTVGPMIDQALELLGIEDEEAKVDDEFADVADDDESGSVLQDQRKESRQKKKEPRKALKTESRKRSLKESDEPVDPELQAEIDWLRGELTAENYPRLSEKQLSAFLDRALYQLTDCGIDFGPDALEMAAKEMEDESDPYDARHEPDDEHYESVKKSNKNLRSEHSRASLKENKDAPLGSKVVFQGKNWKKAYTDQEVWRPVNASGLTGDIPWESDEYAEIEAEWKKGNKSKSFDVKSLSANDKKTHERLSLALLKAPASQKAGLQSKINALFKAESLETGNQRFSKNEKYSESRGRRGKKISEAEELVQHGFDLTTFDNAESFQKVLSALGLPSTPTQDGDGVFIWKTAGLQMRTGNNPITGEYASRTTKRKPEPGYASYIGIEGTAEKVAKLVAAIHAQDPSIKDETPGENRFI